MQHDGTEAHQRRTLTETLQPILHDISRQEGRPSAEYTAMGWVGASTAPSHQLRDVLVRHRTPDHPGGLRTVGTATQIATTAATFWALQLLTDVGADVFDASVGGIDTEHPCPSRRPRDLPQLRPIIETACWTDPGLEWPLLSDIDAMVTIVRGDLADFEDPPEDTYRVDILRHTISGYITSDVAPSESRLKRLLAPTVADLRSALTTVLSDLSGDLSFTWRVAPPSAHQRMSASHRIAGVAGQHCRNVSRAGRHES